MTDGARSGARSGETEAVLRQQERLELELRYAREEILLLRRKLAEREEALRSAIAMLIAIRNILEGMPK